MSMTAGDFSGRRAPYAPISALQGFFTRIRDRQVPGIVDHTFLEKLNVASNNEYALLSALKFLGVVDDRGKPTHAYRLLQTTDRFEPTLKHLVLTAYKPVFDAGGNEWPPEDLVNFFRVSSSASQAKNAARFFYAVCRLAGLGAGEAAAEVKSPPDEEPVADVPAGSRDRDAGQEPRTAEPSPALAGELLRAKAHLLEKLPAADPSWSAAEYQAVCDRFLAMLDSLDRSAGL
jgi:hypothetical protein